MPYDPEEFLKVVYRIAAVRRQDEPWHTGGLIGSAMPPGTLITLEPPPPAPGTHHFLLGVDVTVDGVPREFVAGRIEDDGHLCLFADRAHDAGLQVGQTVELRKAPPRR